MIRNGIGFYLHYSAYNTITNKGETGDVANHHLKFVIDGIETNPINSPEAIALDEYRIFIDSTESSGAKFIRLGGISDTLDVYIISADVITDLLKPGVSFIGCYTAWDGSTNTPKLLDAINHSMFIAQDNTVSAAPGQSEVNTITLPGTYKVTSTGVQSDGKAVSIIGESTDSTNIIPTELAPYNEDQAVEDNVRDNINYAESTLQGNLSLPVESDVRKGVKYGANGIEFIGDLSTGSTLGGFDEAITIEREDTPGNFSGGNYVKGSTTITDATASVQPLTGITGGRDLLLLPESDRVKEVVKIFISVEVIERDIITVVNTNKKYMVKHIYDWSRYGFNHYKTLCVLIKET